jgi:hypothetical protein
MTRDEILSWETVFTRQLFTLIFSFLRSSIYGIDHQEIGRSIHLFVHCNHRTQASCRGAGCTCINAQPGRQRGLYMRRFHTLRIIYASSTTMPVAPSPGTQMYAACLDTQRECFKGMSVKDLLMTYVVLTVESVLPVHVFFFPPTMMWMKFYVRTQRLHSTVIRSDLSFPSFAVLVLTRSVTCPALT